MSANTPEKRNLGKTLVVYLGTAGVFIELFNYIVARYGLQGSFSDAIVILAIFGLPAALIHEWHYRSFTRKALWIHLINSALALTVIFYSQANPNQLKPTELRLLQFRKNQKELASSVGSIAILPFTNLTGDNTQEYMAQGMHEELIGQMGAVSGLRIIGRTSTALYANTEKSLHEIAGELQVDAIIEGSLLPAPEETLKLQVRLIGDMPRELQLWTKSYELRREEVLELYDDIIRTVSDEINIALSPDEEHRMQTKRPVDPEAYEFYLRGRTNFSYLTPEMVNVAEQNFKKSLEIDPQFAPAYAGLAGVWIARKQLNHPGFTQKETEPKYSEYIRKSFALDSTDAEVWRMYATELAYDYNWQGCRDAIERCLELNPNFAEAHAFYAHFEMMQSNWEKAWEEIEIAREQDPLNPMVNFFYKVMLDHSGQYEKVGLVASGDLGFMHYGFQKKNDSVIISLSNSNLLKMKPDIAADFKATYLNEGYEVALNKLADTLGALSEPEDLDAAFITILYQFAENRDKTAQWIERMYIRRDPNLPYFAIRHPSKTQWLFEDPRIKEVMRRIGLWE
ncbi:hypothetical protein ACT6NV_13220 [Robiginitalea sp. IMCC44478]|uniref:hypothetical protein n=1 Tax=Robiginitalea sp. IMCC44478 TaxID=3459122 RepID=UPI0040426841